jgi:hypothetical protein
MALTIPNHKELKMGTAPATISRTVTVGAGWGYWDLSQYPRGGCFRRLVEDTTLTVDTEHQGEHHSEGGGPVMRPNINAMMPYVTALRVARDAIELQLRREGRIVSQVKAATLSQMAQELLERDRERLIAEAVATIAKWQKRPSLVGHP